MSCIYMKKQGQLMLDIFVDDLDFVLTETFYDLV